MWISSQVVHQLCSLVMMAGSSVDTISPIAPQFSINIREFPNLIRWGLPERVGSGKIGLYLEVGEVQLYTQFAYRTEEIAGNQGIFVTSWYQLPQYATFDQFRTQHLALEWNWWAMFVFATPIDDPPWTQTMNSVEHLLGKEAYRVTFRVLNPAQYVKLTLLKTKFFPSKQPRESSLVPFQVS